MIFKKHLSQGAIRERFCHQDNLKSNTTTNMEEVTCKKCLRSVIKQSQLRGNRKRANAAASVLITLNVKQALGPNMELLGLDNK